MKRKDKLVEAALNFAVELHGMSDRFPEQQMELLLFEIIRESISICVCIDMAVMLDDEETKKEYLPKAYSATFRIEVLLEISRELKYLETIDRQLRALEHIRDGVDRRINRRESF